MRAYTALVVVVLFAWANPLAAEAQLAVAVVAPGNAGKLHLDVNGNGVFAVIAANLGTTPGYLSALGWCGGFFVSATGAPTTLVCTLNTATGACADTPVPSLSPQILQGTVGTFGVLVFGGTPGGRINVKFMEWSKPNGLDSSSIHCGFNMFVAERAAVSIGIAPNPGAP